MSLRQYISQHLVTPETMLIDQGAYGWERGVGSTDRLLGNLIRSEYLRYLQIPNTGSVVILTHSFFYEFMKSWPSMSFATLLRDPVKRILSQFWFQKRAFDYFREEQLKPWLDSLPASELNMQTAALSGVPIPNVTTGHLLRAKANLHYFDFVGLVDHYDAALRLFNRIYGINAQGPPPNVNSSPEPITAPASLVEELRDRCCYDIELVDYAQRLYRAKLAALELHDGGDPERIPPSLVSNETVAG